MYLSLFNGRQHPEQDMENQPNLGETGPVIGPVRISWVMGKIRVHTPCGSQFHFLPTSSGGEFIYINGVHYADVEIWKGTEPIVQEALESGRELLDFDAVKKLPEGPDQVKK